jgi:hypothetical protein
VGNPKIAQVPREVGAKLVAVVGLDPLDGHRKLLTHLVEKGDRIRDRAVGVDPHDAIAGGLIHCGESTEARLPMNASLDRDRKLGRGKINSYKGRSVPEALWRVAAGGGAIVGIVICVMAPPAWGQETPRGGAGDQPPAPTTAPSPAPEGPSPSLAAYPLELLGLLAPPIQRGPITLMPSMSVSVEYNDNLFLNNQNRQWDLLTGFSPAITLFVNRPSYELRGGYTFTADVYERESRFNSAFDHQSLVASGVYRAARGLTFTASDSFALDRNTNRVAAEGFASGRQESWSNTFAPGMTWQITPGDTLGLDATYLVQRFTGAGLGSDTYGLQSHLDHAFTLRLTGSIGYGFTYLDLEGQENSATHTPTLGVSYHLTRTLRGSVSGGPSITQLGSETLVSAAGAASLVQDLRFGSASVQYTRAVSAAGGFGGATDTQSASGTLSLPTLLRGLVVVFSPAYSIAESVSRGQTEQEQVDVKVLTLNLGVTYQIAHFASFFGGYTFLRQRTGGQRTGGSSSVQFDVDQNRVRFGVQFGYPINFY